MNYREESLKLHYEWKGKIEIKSRVSVDSRDSLSLAYTPGVAEPCLEIQKDINKSFLLTRRWNTVAVITDGTAILGLGDIGPEAGMPVMEGKCALFKEFGDVDAIPLCLRTKDTEEIIRTISLLEGSFGGINLEDISAPRSFEIESRLKEICKIPVFHDDQHGTAIVVGAALINALKVVDKSLDKITVVINGAGAAGISIGKYLMKLGVKNVIMCDKFGIICEGDESLSKVHTEISKITNKNKKKGNLAEALKNSDVFIGVSAPNIISREMISTMAKNSICFPLANPVAEISREEAIAGGAAVVGTGSSANPNQINNALVFPGIFRGALDTRAKDINTEMMIAASFAISDMVGDKLSKDFIIPYAYDINAHNIVAKKVAEAAIKSGVAQILER